MFILRRITSESNESNTSLGKHYSFVSRETNNENFYRTYSAYLGDDPDKVTDEFKKSVENEVFAFIISDDGSNLIPLWEKSFYYVMMSDGKTFTNLTYKPNHII